MRGAAAPRGATTLFSRTALTIGAAVLGFQIVTLAALFYFVVLPLVERSSDDLAALMILSAKTWRELPPETRADFAAALRQQHNLWYAPDDFGDQVYYPTPYAAFLTRALIRRTDDDATLHTVTLNGERWFVAQVPVGEARVRFAVPHAHLGVSPPSALLASLAGAVVLVVLTAWLLARRVTRPLARLGQASRQIARGQQPPPLPEDGPYELAVLVKQFNRMTHDIHEMLANRTTLLAGISHDLRTPISRMRLALEMIDEQADPKLIGGMHSDLEQMEKLISEYIDLARQLSQSDNEDVNVVDLITQTVDAAKRAGAEIRWHALDHCVRNINRAALQRVLGNLVDNAVRYGAGKPIDILLKCGEEPAIVHIMDRGSGIPADQRAAVFQPFYRLEGSRSRDGGGSGLGLAIARQLVDAQGWDIELHDRRGGGTDAMLVLHQINPAPS